MFRSFLAATTRAGVATVALVREAYEGWRQDRAIRIGAGLSYYAVFAAVPIISSVIAVAGLLFSEDEIRNYLADVLVRLLSEQALATATEFAAVVDDPATIGGLSAVAVVMGVFAGSVLFVAIQDAFNVLWGVPVARGWRYSVRRRLLAMAAVFLAGALLAFALFAHTVVVVVDAVFPDRLSALNRVSELLATAVGWGIGVFSLAVLFKLLVRVPLGWRVLLIAAGVTSTFFILGTWALGLYFEKLGSLSLNGVTSAVLIVLVWLYYTAQILLGGAELLKALDRRYPSGVEAT